MVFFVLCLLCLCGRLFIWALWSPTGKGLTSWLSFVVSNCDFVTLFLFCLVFAMFCARLFICALWSPAGKGLTSWLSFVASSVSLSLSHWYPGSGVVLDCIDSWSMHHYLLFPLVSWVRCGTWLYWFLIFVPLLSLLYHISIIKQSRPWSGSSYKSCLIWVYPVCKSVKRRLYEING